MLIGEMPTGNGEPETALRAPLPELIEKTEMSLEPASAT